MASNVEQNRKSALAFIHAIGSQDAHTLLNLFCLQGRFWQNGKTLPTAGWHTLEETANMTPKIYARIAGNMEFDIISITAEEDRVAVESESHAKLVNGKNYNNQYHFFFRFNNEGKIIEFKEYWDTQHAFETLFDGKASLE